MWWLWVLIAWSGTAVVVALALGWFLNGAERLQVAAQPGTPGARASRRPQRLPVPRVAVALAAAGVGLELIGLVVRSAGLERGALALLSMDAPGSLPRLFVTGLFLATALAGVYGALRLPRRRTWWLAVALVAGAVATVKAGGTVHERVLREVAGGVHPVVAGVGSAAVAGLVLLGLLWSSRHERRDRRRVLGALGLYVAASVGLSTVSSLAVGAWAGVATFVEESGEALAGVTVLVAVLAGVAPQLVLPAAWLARRADDRLAVEVEARLPGSTPLQG